MSVFDIRPIFDGGWLLYEQKEVCMYLVCGTEKAALIDAGIGSGDLLAEVRALTELPVLPLLTHGHPDHYLGVMSCPFVYIHEKDRALMKQYTEMIAQEEGISVPPLPEMRAMPDCFDLGGRRLKVVDLPGHTQGSVGFLLEEERVLFSGDGIIYNVWMQLDEASTVTEYRKVLESVRPLRSCFDKFWTGHGAEALDADHLERVIALADRIIEEPFGVHNPPNEPPGFIADGDRCQITYRKDKIR